MPDSKVVLVTHYFPSHRGGLEIVAGELACGLVRSRDIQVDWYASDCDPTPAPVEGLRLHPVATTNFIERFLGLPWPIWTLQGASSLFRATREASVVHLHDFIYGPSIVAFLAAKRHRRPIVITQHIGHVPYDSALLRAALSLINRTIGAWMLSRANQVIFISPAVQDYFSRFVRWRGRAPAHIPNGTDLTVFRPLPADQRRVAREALGLDLGRPLFLFVGRFTEKKGLPLLRKMADALPGSQFLLAGHGVQRPEEWGLPNVRVLRDRSGPSLAPCYQAADLLVLPSRGEGFPLVVQEAMACGTPSLVGSDTARGAPAARDFLLHEMVEGADVVERWVKRLGELADDPSTLEALRPRVAEFAARHWGWTACVDAYSRIFASLRSQAGADGAP